MLSQSTCYDCKAALGIDNSLIYNPLHVILAGRHPSALATTCHKGSIMHALLAGAALGARRRVAAAIPSAPRRAITTRVHASRRATTCRVGRTRRTSTTAGRAATGTRRLRAGHRAPPPGRHRPEQLVLDARHGRAAQRGLRAGLYWVRPERRVGPGRARSIFTAGLLAASGRIMAPEDRQPCCVVAQGGLAPVGVYLASRSSTGGRRAGRRGPRAERAAALRRPGRGPRQRRGRAKLGIPAVVARAAVRQTAPEQLLRASSSRTCSSSPMRATRRGSAIAWWTTKGRNLSSPC